MKRTTVIALLGLVLALMLGLGTAVAAPASQPIFPDPQEAITQAVNWLIAAHQNDDGGYSSYSGGANLAPSDIGGTMDALLALGSADAVPPETLDYLQNNVEAMLAYAATDGASAGKLVWALTAAGQDPYNFAGEDFVAVLKNHLQADGSYNIAHPFGQSLALLGLAAAGEPVPPEALAWLVNLQSSEEGLDGSWDDGFGTLGNPDATAVALMALIKSGTADYDDNIARASEFLANARLETGGWEYGPGLGQNGNSTAMVVQAIGAMGIEFQTLDADGSDVTPLDALLSYQSETGAFQADFGSGPFDDFFTTVQAIPALVSVSAPVPVLISQPVEEPTVEPTAVPTEEPTAAPTEEPTAVPTIEPTAVPEPTIAPVEAEPTQPAPEPIPEPVETGTPAGSAAPITLVVLALALAGGAYWYLKK